MNRFGYPNNAPMARIKRAHNAGQTADLDDILAAQDFGADVRALIAQEPERSEHIN